LNSAAAGARSIVDSRTIADTWSLNAAAASARTVRGQLRDARILDSTTARAGTVANSRTV